MDLKRLNVIELDSKELFNFEGGNWLRTTIWGTIAYELASNWDAIKAGVSDGWNGTYNNKY
jgi:hypothetical protein